jgi:ribonucleotide reductase beta subunit family protein with ferritin-like domain
MSFKWQGEDSRLSLFPIKNKEIWEWSKTIEALHWVVSEIDISNDPASWKTLKPEEQQVIKMTLAFFSRVDIDVLSQLSDISAMVDCMEASFWYSYQKAQECVHAEAYATQIDVLISDEAEKERLLNSVKHFPIIKEMRDWINETMLNSDLATKLVVFAAVEGIMFQPHFATLQWLREKNVLPGVTTFNEFISRDEILHADFTCLLIKKYLAFPAPGNVAKKIIMDLMHLIDKLIDISIPSPLSGGLSAANMKQYARFQADRIFTAMGYYPSIYGSKNPFKFMEKFLMNESVKTNFFEHIPTQYQGVKDSSQIRLELDKTPIEI